MAETEHEILISADGTAAIGALNGVSNAFNGISKAHGHLKTNFTERFQHIGVELFGHQVLKTMGVVGPMRQVLSTVNMAVGQFAAGIGLAGSAIAPYVFGLTALAAVFQLVSKHHKDITEELAKSNKAVGDQTKAYTETLGAIAEYNKELGHLPQSLKDVRDATLEALGATEKMHTHTMGMQMAEIQRAMALEREHLGELQKNASEIEELIAKNNGAAISWKGYSLTVDEARRFVNKYNEETGVLNTKLTQQQAQYATLKGDIAAIGKGFLSAADMAKSMTKEHKDASDTAEKHAAALRGLNNALSGLQAKEAEYQQTLAGFDSSMAGKISASRKWEIAQEQIINRTYANEVAAARKAGLGTQALQRQHQATLTALHAAGSAQREAAERQFWGISAQYAQGFGLTFMTAFNTVSQTFSQNFAKMMLDGKHWSESFQGFVKNVAQTFVAAVIEMQIRWAALLAMRGLAAMFSGGASEVAAGGINELTTHGMLSLPILPQATGGSHMVTSPTLFLAGEAGPERATFTPMGGGGGGRGGGGPVFNITQNISGAANPTEVGREIVRQIRGMGQIDYRRTA